MQPDAYLNLYGSLLKTMGHKTKHLMKIPLSGPAPLPSVLSRHGIPIEKV